MVTMMIPRGGLQVKLHCSDLQGIPDPYFGVCKIRTLSGVGHNGVNTLMGQLIW